MQKLINLLTILIFTITLSFPVTQNLSTDLLKCDCSKSPFLDDDSTVREAASSDGIIKQFTQQERYLIFVFTEKQEARENVGRVPVVNFAYVLYITINNNIDPITGRDYSETADSRKELAVEAILSFADTAAVFFAGSTSGLTGVSKSAGSVRTVGKGFGEVAEHILKNGKLPGNFITKAEARALGWNPAKGNLGAVAPGKSIGGDIFRNSEGLLPNASGRTWFEADINFTSGFRGSDRLLYSSDGLLYKTVDHYKTFIPIK